MLRASSEHAGEGYRVDPIMGGSGDSGVPEAALLLEFSEAMLGDDQQRRNAARSELFEKLGPEALVDAAGIVASFDAVVKIADACGIPLEAEKAAATKQLREDLDINKMMHERST